MLRLEKQMLKNNSFKHLSQFSDRLLGLFLREKDFIDLDRWKEHRRECAYCKHYIQNTFVYARHKEEKDFIFYEWRLESIPCLEMQWGYGVVP